MAPKVGRNDPCRCGSGKKFKHCCGDPSKASGAIPRDGHDRAIERAMGWLTDRHRKAVVAALEDLLIGQLNADEAERFEQLDDEVLHAIQLNALEWLLAEGKILVKGTPKRAIDCVLGPGGPLFTIEERQFLTQLMEQPLNLYTVTHVVPGRQITLCDAVDISQSAIIVRERSGSETLEVGTYLGGRVLTFENHSELSGAIYPFSRIMGPETAHEITAWLDGSDDSPSEKKTFIGLTIRRKWLEQYVRPLQIPTMMDAHSGDPILLITEHYRVTNWQTLSSRLENEIDVDGDEKSGWTRLVDCEDGLKRSLAAINIEPTSDRISVFYKTRNAAETGRVWFDHVAGDAVTYLTQEISDPSHVFTKRPDTKISRRPASNVELFSELPDGLLSDAIAQALQRAYAGWADQPLPVLGGQTPKQAAATPTGTERVKGLIRSYEAGERDQAVDQHRSPVSFEFLWKQVGMSPD